jgi:hypothetical protein
MDKVAAEWGFAIGDAECDLSRETFIKVRPGRDYWFGKAERWR